MRAVAGLLACAPALALAAGFAVPELSAKTVGMGGVGAASDLGASSLYYNPGAIGFEDGAAVEVAGALVVPTFDYRPPAGASGTATSALTQVFVLPSVFALAPIGPLHVGLSAFSNFGLGLEWPAAFDGRFEVQSISLQTYTLNATLGWKAHEHVSLAAGFDMVRGAVELRQRLNLVDAEGLLHLGGGTWGAGANAGVLTRWLDDGRLTAGLTWRSAVALPFAGRADFVVPPEFETQLQDQAVRTTLVLPHVFTLAVGFRPVPKLQLALDASYTTWSSLDALRFDFDDDALDQVLRRDWTNSFTVRLGAQWEVVDKLTLRLGAGFDQTPSPADTLSPSLPDCHRVLASVGAGYRLGNFSVDLGYLLAILVPRTSEGAAFPASYSGMAHVAALSLSFRQ